MSQQNKHGLPLLTPPRQRRSDRPLYFNFNENRRHHQRCLSTWSNDQVARRLEQSRKDKLKQFTTTTLQENSNHEQ